MLINFDRHPEWLFKEVKIRSVSRHIEFIQILVTCQILIPVCFLKMQTQERLHVALLAQKGAIPSRRLLLEETQGRQDDERGPHETQSSRHRGKHLDLAFFFKFKSSGGIYTFASSRVSIVANVAGDGDRRIRPSIATLGTSLLAAR